MGIPYAASCCSPRLPAATETQYLRRYHGFMGWETVNRWQYYSIEGTRGKVLNLWVGCIGQGSLLWVFTSEQGCPLLNTIRVSSLY